MWNSSDHRCVCMCVPNLRLLFPDFFVLAFCLHYTTFCAHKIWIGCYIYCYLCVSHIFLYYSSHPCTKWIDILFTYVRTHAHTHIHSNTQNTSRWIIASGILIWCYCLYFYVLCILYETINFHIRNRFSNRFISAVFKNDKMYITALRVPIKSNPTIHIAVCRVHYLFVFKLLFFFAI